MTNKPNSLKEIVKKKKKPTLQEEFSHSTSMKGTSQPSDTLNPSQCGDHTSSN